jgi:hypothetical protein
MPPSKKLPAGLLALHLCIAKDNDPNLKNNRYPNKRINATVKTGKNQLIEIRTLKNE